MRNPLVRKLENFVRLSEDDKVALRRLSRSNVRRFSAHDDLIVHGESPASVNLILDGWVCRYKHLEDGRRQIINFLLPGDLCDLHIFILRQLDHSVGALTDATVARVTRQDFESVTIDRPRVTQALLWETLVMTSIQREWTVNLGQRNATERVAHLICELYTRLQAVDLATDGICPFPVTQADLADASGLSLVHLNRTIQELRAAELIVLKNKTLTIPSLDALKMSCLFRADYLHLENEGRHLDANE